MEKNYLIQEKIKRKKARKSKSKNIKPKVELGLQYHDQLQVRKKKVKVDDGFSVSHIIRQLSPWKWALLRDF